MVDAGRRWTALRSLNCRNRVEEQFATDASGKAIDGYASKPIRTTSQAWICLL